jgi:5'-nucleotidase
MTVKPLILVSNDDSIFSKGIASLVNILKTIAEVVVVAPDKAQSGMGHAITLDSPLRLNKSVQFGEDIEAYQCSGTPADCVKIAKHHVLKDRTIDLVCSGINHGSNSSISVVYSGTMSAALEAAIESLPAIGFSVCEYGPEATFSHGDAAILKIVQHVLTNGMEKGIALNVNIPKVSDQPIKGIKIARQAKAWYKEQFLPKEDPYGRPYYWTDGALYNPDNEGGTDEDALNENYVSIVPCQFDLTAYKAMQGLKVLE